MRLNFDQLYTLWLIPLILAVIILPFIKYAKKNARQKVFLGLRILATILIILSISGVKLVKIAKDTTTIFVSDLSNSTIDQKKQIEEFILEGIKAKGEHDLTGIISFGADSQAENHPSKGTIFNGFQTSVDSNFTNIQGALIHSAALFPPNTQKRIVLITDGLENMGDSERQIRALRQNNTIVDVYGIEKGDFEEVQLSKVLLPQKAGKNQIIEIAAHIDSNVKTKATILLYGGNALKYRQQVDLDIGTNKFIFTDTISSNGVLTYRVEILPEKDTHPENNYLSSFVAVNDLPVILLIQDEDKQGEQLIKMLDEDMIFDVKAPEEAPQSFEALIKYDGFILADISIERFSQDFLNNLEKVIKNQGKGLLVTGGDSSYGPGGYYQTILEEMLPVNIDVKPKEEKPNLGLVLVIDKSGSMTEGQYGVSKLELAKEAAIRSTDVLDEKDFLGVIAFDDSVKWVIEPQLATDKQALQDQIATIVPGGGTSIRPSLEAAVDSLIEIDAKLKHIILLTDGQAETTGYEGALNKLRDNSITLSTVAVGKGADKTLLRVLASAGGGRYYLTDEFTDIPSIFTKEAFMAGKKYLNNITFSPNLISSSQILKGIESIPQLDGYVATSIKPNSKLLLAGPEDDPILATGQYGLGRTISWTSDANGLWTGKWLNWEQSPSFWSNMIHYMVQQDIDKKYIAETSYKAGEGIITVKSLEKEAPLASQIEGILITPEGEEKPVSLEATAPGTYTGSFEASGEGVYMVNLLLEAEGFSEKIVTGLNVGYSPEYDFYSNVGISPESIAEISGGRVLKSPKDIFKGELPQVIGSKDISKLLLIIAFILFLSEIIIRKTELRFAFIDKAWNKTREGINAANSKVKIRINEIGENKKTKEQDNEVLKPKKEKPQKPQKRAKETTKTKDTSHLDVLLEKKKKRGQ